MIKNQPFIFVNYLSRSGSTLLCSLLDQYSDIDVGIEAGFPGFPEKITPNNDNPIHSKAEVSDYLDQLYSDNRFCSWNIPRENLEKTLLAQTKPITFELILEACFNQYFNQNLPKYIVHKAGYFIKDLETTRTLFPGSHHIYVTRDPRAIYASQKNAISLYNNKPMALNLYRFCREFKLRHNIAMANKSANDFSLIQYEKMASNPTANIEKILSKLSISSNKKNNTDYQQKIPDAQKSLHKNLDSAPNQKSIDKWKEQLSDIEIFLIECLLTKELSSLRYTRHFNHFIRPLLFLKSLIVLFRSFLKF